MAKKRAARPGKAAASARAARRRRADEIPTDRLTARAMAGDRDASREGAMLRLNIYKRMSVAAPAWVRRFMQSGGV